MKKIKTLIIALALISMFSPAVFADMSGEDCRKAAENFLSYIGSDKEIVSVKTLEKDGEIIGYVMTLENGGYILMSVSEALTPVKAYSLTSPFDTLPQWYKSILITELSAAIQPEYRESAGWNENAERWDFLLSYSEERNSPRYTADTYLLKTQWNQSPIYNKALPQIDGKYVVTGCVQTALGQIMKYHKHPAKGSGVLTHNWNNQQLKAVLYKTYNWGNMPDVLDSSSPLYMQDEVAALMRDLGIADKANFGVNETSASANTTALIENFGYAADIKIMNNADATAFFNTLKSEIDSGRPVELNFPGHATVADGYASDATGNKVHVNMGWGGHYNEFYYLDKTVQAGSYSFAPDLEIIYNIRPCEGDNCYSEISKPESPDALSGSKITGKFHFEGDSDIYETYLKGNTKLTGDRKYSNQAFYITVFKTNGEVLSSSDEPVTLDIPVGKYFIKIALENENGGYPYDAMTDYTVTISTQTLTAEETAQVSAYDNSPVINNDFSDMMITEPQKLRIDATDEDGDAVSLSVSASDTDVTASLDGNILTLTPAAAKGHSRITVTARAKDKSVQKSFNAVVFDEMIYFGKQFVINGTFANQTEFDRYKAILDGQCSITGYNGYSNQAFFSSVLDATGQTYLAPMSDKQIQYKGENKLYLIEASLKKSASGGAYYPYSMGKGDSYSLTVSCPDANADISAIAESLGIDVSASPSSVPVITGLSDDISPVKTKVWEWDASSDNLPVTFSYQTDQNKTGTPPDVYSDIKTVSKSGTTGGTWYLHVQAKDAKGNKSAVTTVSAVLVGVTGPANDNFANAVELTGVSDTKTGSNTDATKETGEPDHAGNTGGKSVWWKWTVPETGYFSFDTAGSDFDTLLSVYTGSSLDGLTEAAANNDVKAESSGDLDNPDDKTSRVTFYAEQGKLLYIAVDGYGLTSGNITLKWAKEVLLTNDKFADANGLTGETGSTTASNASATKEFGEPLHAENAGGKSLWWSWTAPTVKDDYSGFFSFDTHDSDFDTLLAVYTGTAPNNLKIVEFNDDDTSDGGTSSLSFRAQTGTRYYIAVDGKNAASGNIVLNWRRLTPTGKDNFADAEPLSETSRMTVALNASATKETDEPQHAGNSGEKSLWWKGTAPEDGYFAFDTHGSDFDTLLAVYTGESVNALTKIADNDDDRNDGTSHITFPVKKENTYYFVVDGNNGASGNIILNWRAAFPPENDNFANAATLTGTTGKTTAVNTDATKETGEPNHAGDINAENTGGKSLWWKWTAPTTGGRYAFDTHGSDFDTTLAVYTGSALDTLTPATRNDDDKLDGNSGLTFAAEPGKQYYIAVDGYMGISGNIVLNWRAASAPANDNFSNAVELESATSGKVEGSNTDATRETGEPNHANTAGTYPDRIGNTSVWWKWTAPASGNFFFTVAGSEKFYKLIGIYTGSTLDTLKEAAGNNQENYQNFVNFSAVKGTQYSIACDGYQGGAGKIVLSWGIPPVGDADGNGEVALKDALLIFLACTGDDTGTGTLSLTTGDASGNGSLGMEDVSYILKEMTKEQ